MWDKKQTFYISFLKYFGIKIKTFTDLSWGKTPRPLTDLIWGKHRPFTDMVMYEIQTYCRIKDGLFINPFLDIRQLNINFADKYTTSTEQKV